MMLLLSAWVCNRVYKAVQRLTHTHTHKVFLSSILSLPLHFFLFYYKKVEQSPSACYAFSPFPPPIIKYHTTPRNIARRKKNKVNPIKPLIYPNWPRTKKKIENFTHAIQEREGERERTRGVGENMICCRKIYAGPITLASPDAGLTDHKSRDHPISRNLLLPEPDGLFSPVAMASALLQAAKASTSSVMRLAPWKASLRSESRSATKDASSMHSSRLSRDRPVPAN